MPEYSIGPNVDHRVIRNAFLNLLGQGIPLLLAILAIPPLIAGLGTERFGALTLVWVLVGYFGMFDLGVGRAATKFISSRLATNDHKEIPSIFWSSMVLLGALGLLGAVLVFFLMPVLNERVLNIPGGLVPEVRESVVWIAMAIPIVLVTSGLRGVLEAHQRFGILNAIKIPANIMNYLLPLAVLPFSRRLPPVVAALVAGRFLVFAVHLAFCLRTMPELSIPVKPGRAQFLEFLGFGAWMMVSNITFPLMGFLDRFFIGAYLAMDDVTFYVTPYEVVSKIWVISISLQSALFPALSALAISNREGVQLVTDRMIKGMVLVYTPLVGIVIAMAGPFLNAWVGPVFADRCEGVMQILALGALVNAVGGIPYIAILGMGRADLVAKFHLVQLPIFLLMITVLIKYFGIVGVALAGTLRFLLDTTIWFWLGNRLNALALTGKGRNLLGQIAFACVGLLAFTLAGKIGNLPVKIFITLLITLGVFFAGYNLLLSDPDRSEVRGLIRNMARYAGPESG